MNATEQELAVRCLGHLQQEDAMLQESWELVKETRRALLDRDQLQLQQLLERQEQMAQSADRLRTMRDQIREQVATALAIPSEQASIGLLASRLDGTLRTRMMEYRANLIDTARQVDLLNRANAALALQTVDLFRNVLMRLTGVDPETVCYERTGQFAISSAEPIRSLTSLG